MLVDYLFMYFIILVGTLIIFVSCNVACEYRNYSTGHRLIKAFIADNAYQKSLVILQSTRNIFSHDLKKITYIGYVSSIICTITAIIIIPFSIIMFIFNHGIAFWTFIYWFMGCFSLNVIVAILQILDSLFNLLLEFLRR